MLGGLINSFSIPATDLFAVRLTHWAIESKAEHALFWTLNVDSQALGGARKGEIDQSSFGALLEDHQNHQIAFEIHKRMTL